MIINKKLLNSIVNAMVLNGFLFDGNTDEHQYYFTDGDIVICCVTPHKGTDFKYMILADKIENFYGWGDTYIEEFVNSEFRLSNVIKMIKEYKEEC